MSAPVVVALDARTADELRVALVAYCHALHSRGHTPSPNLAALLRLTTSAAKCGRVADRNGHERAGDQAAPHDGLVNYPDAARILGVSERTARRLVQRGELVPVRIGKRAVRFDRHALDAYRRLHAR